MTQDGLSTGSQPCHPLQVSGQRRGEGLLAAWVPPGPGSQVYGPSVQGRWPHRGEAQTPADGLFIAMAGLQAHGQQRRDTQQVRVLLTEQAGSPRGVLAVSGRGLQPDDPGSNPTAPALHGPWVSDVPAWASVSFPLEWA